MQEKSGKFLAMQENLSRLVRPSTLRRYWFRLAVILHALGSAKGDQGREEGSPVLFPPPLVNPVKGTLKMIIGFAVPVQLSGRVLVYGQNFQFQYGLPDNATLFTNFFEDVAASGRRRRSPENERLTVYQILERELERKGADGKSCLKRSICEAAATPLINDGFVGELLHLLLTPDHGKPDDDGGSPMVLEYIEAAEIGRRNQEDCIAVYSSCPPGYGLLDKISTVH